MNGQPFVRRESAPLASGCVGYKLFIQRLASAVEVGVLVGSMMLVLSGNVVDR
jgi:hypothetical protein